MNKEEFFELAEKYSRGWCTEQEAKLFDSYFDLLQKENGKWDDWDLSMKEKTRLELYQSIKNAISTDSNKDRKWRLNPVFRIAASILIVFSLGLLYYSIINYTAEPVLLTKSTAKGQQATITLSDGSTVRLNADSELSYPEKFDGSLREVQLKGEAYFEVRRNPEVPFTVSSGGVNTTVLGTAFNIKSFEGENTSVTLSSGKVLVRAYGQERTLAPGEQATFDIGTNDLVTSSADLDVVLSWTEGFIQFHDARFEDVIKTLERWYNVDIILVNPEIGACLLSGKFRETKINNVLEGLKFLIDISYETKDFKEIYIRGNSCN